MPVPFRGLKLSQGLVSLEGPVWHGCLRCLLCFKQAPRRPSHACSLSRVETEPGARVARGSCVAWVLAVPALFQAGPEATFSRLCPFEGSPCFARNRAIKCSTVEAAVLRRGHAFLGVATARTRVVGGVGRRT
jgi:hypothetical protein